MNRREMVAALGAIWPIRPRCRRWSSGWRSDEYVPVRAEAAAALGRIGGAAGRGRPRAAAAQREQETAGAGGRQARRCRRSDAPVPASDADSAIQRR